MSMMVPYLVRFSCGHYNHAYGGSANRPKVTESPSKCPACDTNKRRNEKWRPVFGALRITIVPMLNESAEPMYCLFADSPKSRKWEFSYLAFHPTHAFWMSEQIYPNVKYVPPEDVFAKSR